MHLYNKFLYIRHLITLFCQLHLSQFQTIGNPFLLSQIYGFNIQTQKQNLHKQLQNLSLIQFFCLLMQEKKIIKMNGGVVVKSASNFKKI